MIGIVILCFGREKSLSSYVTSDREGVDAPGRRFFREREREGGRKQGYTATSSSIAIALLAEKLRQKIRCQQGWTEARLTFHSHRNLLQ